MTQQLDKLSRGDLIKLVGEELLAELADERQRAAQAVDAAAEAWRASVAAKARQDHATLLINMAAVCGSPQDSIRATVVTRMYLDEPFADVATVKFEDADESFECRLKLLVQVPLSDEQGRLALEWQRALEWQAEAQRRDVRVAAVRAKAREQLVADLLKGPEGREVLDAAKKLARVARDRLSNECLPATDPAPDGTGPQ